MFENIEILLVNGVEMVRLASTPVGGHLNKGIAKVGVRTSWVPGGKTNLRSCVIHKNLQRYLCFVPISRVFLGYLFDLL